LNTTGGHLYLRANAPPSLRSIKFNGCAQDESSHCATSSTALTPICLLLLSSCLTSDAGLAAYADRFYVHSRGNPMSASSTSGSAIWVQNLSSDTAGLCGQRRDAQSPASPWQVLTSCFSSYFLSLREGRIVESMEGIALIRPSAA